ncbi:DUF5791 family protein [Natronolimnobius baerhuensis]|uniref:Uncharacterized protein n=1 Tax=Natronolimnobius baerhuensis TaxID=253108 RepID=A0A202E8I5_9EURY|nr:DUF5791 family protein [Natronolimnobius baerhuensis]OVE84547.1 hypothetical protein B2G88_09090 [Natronolimnobius baerhuensis]
MFHEQRLTVPETPAELRAEYQDDFERALEDAGASDTDASDAAAATDLERERLDAVLAGDEPELSLEEAAQIQALADGAPDAETLVTIACEHLLLGMTTAVLDVDALESELAIEMDAKEIQQKIEQRAPMSFDEYVHIQHAIVANTP